MADLLPDWVPQQRWFGAKGRPIKSVAILSDRTIVEGDPAMRHLLLDVDYSDRESGEDVETYQLLLGRRAEVPDRLQHAVIGREGALALYDAAHDNELTHVLLQLMHEDAAEQDLAFRHLREIDLRTDLTSIVMGAEQSNTSIVFGDEYILKLFRKVAPGLNPDLEITRALAETGTRAVVPPLGWIETAGSVDGEEATTLGMLQPFLRSASEGWS